MRKTDPTWSLQMHTLLCCNSVSHTSCPPPSHSLLYREMASYSNSKPCAENLCDEPPSAFPGSSLAVPDPEPPQQEYDFVEEPPPEYFCLVTFEFCVTPNKRNAAGIICREMSLLGSSEKASRALCVTIWISRSSVTNILGAKWRS